MGNNYWRFKNMKDIEESYNLNKIIFNEEYGLDDVKIYI